jgi:hypothetical protein
VPLTSHESAHDRADQDRQHEDRELDRLTGAAAERLLQPLLREPEPLIRLCPLRCRERRHLVQSEPPFPLLLRETDRELALHRVHEPHEPPPPRKRVGDPLPGGRRRGKERQEALGLVRGVRHLPHLLENAGDRVAQLTGGRSHAAPAA